MRGRAYRQNAIPILVLSGLAVCASGSTARSATLVVTGRPGSTYPTIQSAVNAAVPVQDDVSVLCGIYRENVSMRDGVSVRGRNPRCTILVGLDGSPDPTVAFPALTTTTQLSGFTIRGNGVGPGVAGQTGPVVITQNAIEGGSYGVVIGGVGPMSPVITRNVVRDNVEDGIRVEMAEPSSTATITRNLVVGCSRGVLATAYPGSLTLVNNTIARNRATGVAVYADGDGQMMVTGNVVAWNGSSGANGGIIFYGGAATPEISQNDAWSNTPFDFLVQPGGLPASNFSEDPRFVNEVADFTGFEPRSNSPLVDRLLGESIPARDLRGVPWVSGRGGWGLRADLGARENEGTTGVRYDRNWGLLWDGFEGGGQWNTEYQVLRGDLGVLRVTGVYRQDPGQVPAAAMWCEVPPEGLFDAAVPEAGQGFFYLVTGWSDCENPLGFTSDAQLRPGSVCWGSCPVGP